jgi:NADH-quinone oxidoreductase subunit J
VVAFFLLATVMIIGALGVITLKQPVHAALSLVATLLTLAVTYVTLQAHFLAAIQVIVYAGAIMVLFLFVIMLLNVQGDKPSLVFNWIQPAAYGAALTAAFAIVVTALRNPSQMPDMTIVTRALRGGGAAQIGEALFSEFVLAFQLVGVLLLTGIIGAVSLVQRKAVTAAQPAALVTAPAGGSSGGGVSVMERPTTPKDDLKRIKGIGPKLESLLHRNGVTTFLQIATFTPEEVAALDEQLEEFKGRIERDNWIEQARQLIQEDEQ